MRYLDLLLQAGAIYAFLQQLRALQKGDPQTVGFASPLVFKYKGESYELDAVKGRKR